MWPATSQGVPSLSRRTQERRASSSRWHGERSGAHLVNEESNDIPREREPRFAEVQKCDNTANLKDLCFTRPGWERRDAASSEKATQHLLDFHLLGPPKILPLKAVESSSLGVSMIKNKAEMACLLWKLGPQCSDPSLTEQVLLSAEVCCQEAEGKSSKCVPQESHAGNCLQLVLRRWWNL